MKPSLDSFLLGYVTCALWSSTDDDGRPLGEQFNIEDLPDETITAMRADCDDFRTAQAELLGRVEDEGRNGHDFWLTRNRHGAGFWDRGYGIIGQQLTDAAHVYGESYLYKGDDGLLYIA
jgi:hypothetical protein